MLLRTLAHPPHNAVIRAFCSNLVLVCGEDGDGVYVTVSWTESISDQVKFVEVIVTRG